MAQTILTIYADDFILTCPQCHVVIEEIHVTRLYELSGIECPECYECADLSISLGQ